METMQASPDVDKNTAPFRSEAEGITTLFWLYKERAGRDLVEILKSEEDHSDSQSAEQGIESSGEDEAVRLNSTRSV